MSAAASGPESNVNFWPPPVTLPTFKIDVAAVPVSNTVLAASVAAPMSICRSVVLIVPANDVVVAAVVSSPPVNVIASATASPSVTDTVFKNVVSVVMVPPLLNASA